MTHPTRGVNSYVKSIDSLGEYIAEPANRRERRRHHALRENYLTLMQVGVPCNVLLVVEILRPRQSRTSVRPYHYLW